MTPKHVIKLGTRRSPLALTQATMVRDALSLACPSVSVEIVPMKSKGDWNPADGEQPLCADQRGKALFAKEIEEAILDGQIDCGVHSLKDMDSALPDGLTIRHVLKRADARDIFISTKFSSIEELPAGATIGTCSPRRTSQILSIRNDLTILSFRGNIQTRLDKIHTGQVDASFLAAAGLDRLNTKKNYKNLIFTPLNTTDFTPACGQGIIGIETSQNNHAVREILDHIHCKDTGICATAERSFLKKLNGSCRSCVGCYAAFNDGDLTLHIYIGAIDGKIYAKETETISCHNEIKAQLFAEDFADRILLTLPAGWNT